MTTQEEIAQLLQDIQKRKFWGVLQLEFQQGELSLIRKTETIKTTRKGSNREYGEADRK
jgi:hypothetical protein